MSLFESYQEEFKEISKDVLRDLDAEGDHAAKSKLLRQADKMLTQLGALVKQMEIEARSQEESSLKRSYTEIATRRKEEYATLRRSYTDAAREEESAELLGNPAAESRARLVSANDRLERGSERIRYAMEIAADAENTALEITGELQRNRETMENISSNVRSVSSLTDHAKRIIHSMSKREMYQKMAVLAVAVILTVGLGAFIYFLLQR